MTFGEELKNFSSKYPYQEILIDGVKVRYVHCWWSIRWHGTPTGKW